MSTYLKEIWKKIGEYLSKDEVISESTGRPLSTVAYHKSRIAKRTVASGTEQWETAWGENFLKRMIISVIYTFGIKGGVGSKRISEHLEHLQVEGVSAVSESSIYRLTNEVIANILWYKELQEKGLTEKVSETMEEMEIVLGLDETWLVSELQPIIIIHFC